MTDFFEQQEKSRSATLGLLILYVLAVLSTCLLLHMGLCAAFSFGGSNEEGFKSALFFEYLFNYLLLFAL
jgi:hypothetical protein